MMRVFGVAYGSYAEFATVGSPPSPAALRSMHSSTWGRSRPNRLRRRHHPVRPDHRYRRRKETGGCAVVPVIDRTVDLEHVPEAIRDLDNGRIAGKAAVLVGSA